MATFVVVLDGVAVLVGARVPLGELLRCRIEMVADAALVVRLDRVDDQLEVVAVFSNAVPHRIGDRGLLVLGADHHRIATKLTHQRHRHGDQHDRER